jgi:hypothetical protein
MDTVAVQHQQAAYEQQRELEPWLHEFGWGALDIERGECLAPGGNVNLQSARVYEILRQPVVGEKNSKPSLSGFSVLISPSPSSTICWARQGSVRP